MKRTSLRGPSAFALAAALAVLPVTANAETAPTDASEDAAAIVVTASRTTDADDFPATTATIDAATIRATVNAMNVEDTLKYLPSLTVRKRHVGDTQAPLATRTSGVGASARSLIYADGVLLSALIGNNNGSASPRWGLVAPEEIERVDVSYGPFSAAYPGNSIGAVVSITTRLPDRLEASATAGVQVQQFSQYGTSGTYPSYQLAATLGDRIGPLSLFASVTRTRSEGQPLSYVTALRAARTGTAGTVTAGGYDDLNRTGAPIRVLGASGLERQTQYTIKFKAALDLTPDVRLTYLGGLFLNETTADAQSYLTGPSGQPVYSGALNIDGYPYTVAASAFSNNVYSFAERHWAHSLSATGSGDRLSWQVVGSRYVFDRDAQRVPTTALPAATTGGAGVSTRLDGTGWWTLDARVALRGDRYELSGGVHGDIVELANTRRAVTDWRGTDEGAVASVARGRTRTLAAWIEDVWRPTPTLTVTAGLRYEAWRADRGFNASTTPALSVVQPVVSAGRWSPKLSVAWGFAPSWTARLSLGQAYRFPTVGELYQAVATGPSITIPNPNLRPERARSTELAIEHRSSNSHLRLSAFNEVISDALLSQTAPLVPGSSTLFSYVQNVDETRVRGIEVAFDRRDILPGLDVSGSATFTGSRITANRAFPAAVGKRLPQVPDRRATASVTWRPASTVALTASARYASRSYGTIDNSDRITNTFQGFDGYFVVDLRAHIELTRNLTAGIGIDNVNNDKYFLFHPFPQRTFALDVRWHL